MILNNFFNNSPHSVDKKATNVQTLSDDKLWEYYILLTIFFLTVIMTTSGNSLKVSEFDIIKFYTFETVRPPFQDF